MKYFLACLILPIVSMFVIVLFGVGALCFGVDNLLDQMRQLNRKHSTG
jgi:hypothetical protein